MPKLIELQRQRVEVAGRARATLAELRECLDNNYDEKRAREIERRHDAIMAELDLLDLDIGEARAEAGPDDRTSQRPDQSGSGSGQDLGSADWHWRSSGEWRDARTREPIRVYRSNERIIERETNGPGVGDMARAMIFGARDETERRALAEGSDSSGGYTVPTVLASEFIDKLRARTVVFQAGAQVVPMTSDNLKIARTATDPTVAWTAENAEITASDPTFDAVTLAPKKLTTLVKVSRELLEDSVNVSQMLERAIIGAMAGELDRACLFGSGSGNEPTGLFNISGINSVSMGTNGATITYDKMLDSLYEIELDNGVPPTALIYHPRTALSIRKLKDGDGAWQKAPQPIDQMKNLITTAVPINQTQGSSSVASTLLMGQFMAMLVGIRTSLELRLLNERYAEFDQVGFIARLRADVTVTDTHHFCKLIGIIP